MPSDRRMMPPMRPSDHLRFAFLAVTSHRLRSVLTALGIAVGVAAVILLTSLGEGLHRFVLAEFTQFGTHIVNVNPGRTETHGGSVGAINSVRPLTVDDALALARLPQVTAVNAGVMGNVEVRAGNRNRRVTLYGELPSFPEVFSMGVARGRFLPPDDARAPRAYAVLGDKLRRELFGVANPLGQVIQVGGYRFRVIGVMEAKGQVLGFDLDDTVFIPVAWAQALFDREGVMEIHAAHRPGARLDEVVEGIRRVLAQRHGREDFTITPQQQMLDTLSTVLDVLTFAVASLGGVSLLVGGVGILTLMTITVSERTNEVGLLRALGAGRGRVLTLFLIEAVALSALGGLFGLALGVGLAWLLRAAVPALPVATPWSFVLLALVISGAVGLVSGIAPARHAARLDPVEALRVE